MRYQQLGHSSLRVSSIGFGCMSLENDQTLNAKLVDRALELGINFFDTADIYEKGENEKKLARLLKGKRDQVVLATKVGNQWRSDGSGLDWNPRKEHILRSVEESLLRLGTDRIDLYQLHGGTMEDRIDEVIEAFELLIQQGKIRYYGISSIRPAVIREYVRRKKTTGGKGIVSVMMQYSLLDRRPEESCLKLLQDRGIGVLARGSLAGGLLVDKAAKSYLNYSTGDVARAAEAIRKCSGTGSWKSADGETSEKAGRGPTQTALQFVLQNPAITVAVTGLRTLHQLEEAVKAIDTPALTEAERTTLEDALGPNYYEQHR
jgi:aryl-alcohol dehydrogenase-like predicted oxidoreductase